MGNNSQSDIILSSSNLHKQRYLRDVGTIGQGAKIVLIGFVINLFITFVHSVLVARYLGPELLGLYKLGLKIFQYVTPLSLVGLYSGIVYFNSKFYESKDYSHMKGVLNSSFFISLGLGVALSLSLLFSSSIIARLFDKPRLTTVLSLIALSIPFLAIARVTIASFHSIKNVKIPMYIQQVFRPISQLSIEILVIVFGLGLVGILNAYIVTIIISCLILLRFYRQYFSFLNHEPPTYDIKKVVKYSIPMLFSHYMGLVIFGIDILMLGYFESAAKVGLYGVAANLALMLLIFLKSFNTIFSPIISSLVDQSKFNNLSQLFKLVTRWIFTLSFPIVLTFIFFSENILLIYGESYTAAGLILIILSIFQLMNITSGSVGKILVMSGKSRLDLVNNTLLALINISLNYWLIPRYSVVGAALATGSSITLVMGVRLVELYLLHRIHPYEKDYWKPLSAGAALCLTFIIVKQFRLFEFSILLFAIAIIGAWGIYGLVLYNLGLKEDDKALLANLKSNLPIGGQ